jgi:hypothetical protein
VTLTEYMYVRRAGWAAEEGKPLPPCPQEIWFDCARRYVYEWRKRNTGWNWHGY